MTDRNATVRRAMNDPTHASVKPFNDALEHLRLEGAIYLRAEYTEPCCFCNLPGSLEGQGQLLQANPET